METYRNIFFVIFMAFCAVLFWLTLPITTVIHELGHAIPTMIFTRKKVIVYIGSHGNKNKSLRLNCKYIEFYFSYNTLTWKKGLCESSPSMLTINQSIIIILSGPLASFIIAFSAVFIAFTYDLHGFLKLFLIIFTISAILDLFINLIPDKTPIILEDGNVTYNDGFQLKQLIRLKKMPVEYFQAIDFYNENNFSETVRLCENVIKCRPKDIDVFRLAVIACLQSHSYEKAKELTIEFTKLPGLNSEDYTNIALSFAKLGYHDEANDLYDKSLQLNPANKYSLNNKGYLLTQLLLFHEAIILFNKALEIDVNFSHAYNNRGFCKIKTGQTEEGLKEIKFSLELDNENSYAYKNLGIYYSEMGDYKEALNYYKRAKDLDDSTYLIDELITEVINKVENTKNENNLSSL